MMPRSHSHRPQVLGLEARLCSFAFPGYETMKDAAGAVADFTTEWGKWTLEKGASGYNNIKETVKYYWQMDTRSDYREQLMQNTAQFFELASPDMLRVLNEGFQKESVDSFATLDDMLNHAKWIDAFSTPDIFDDIKRPMEAFTMKKGPLGLVLSLSAPERKRMYAGYVDRFIPWEIQEKHKDIFGADPRDPAHEGTLCLNGAILNDSMRYMLGTHAGFPLHLNSTALAREVLENRYKFTGQKLTVNGVDIADRANLRTDFEMLTGGVPRLADIRDLQGMATPSFLKGAATMGVLTDADVEHYVELGRLRHRDLDAMRDASGRQVEDLTKVTKKELAREAMSMSDVWYGMGGFEKLALIVAAFFALQSKGVRNTALWGAAMYYGAKFFGKVEKPFVPVEKGVQGVTSMFFNMPGVKEAREAIGITSNVTTQESIERGQIVSEFLTDDAKEQIDASVTGFRLLHDMPMNELARYVEFGDFTGVNHKGVLRTHDPAFQTRARRILETRGLDKNAIDRFFKDTSRAPIELSAKDAQRLGVPSLNWNAVETGDALATAFYLSASDDPSLSDDVRFVEEARAAYGGSYDAIVDGPFTDRAGREANAKQIFFDVARHGKHTATSQTLGQFMAERMGLRNPPKSQAEALEDSKFNRKKKELEDYKHMDKSAKLSVTDKSNVVEVGQLDGLSLKSPIVMPKAEFLAKSVKEIAVQWVTPLIAKHKADILAAVPVGYAYGRDFDAKAVAADAELVGFAPVLDIAAAGITLPVAETSAYKFIQVAPADILAKYEAYEKALAAGTPVTGKDPL